MQYKSDTLFEFVRNLVLRHATDPAAKRGMFSNDLTVTVNGFEFSLLSRQRGAGLVRVFEPATGVTWAQQCLNGDDICLRVDGEGNPAQWIAVALRHRMGIPQDHYRPTPTVSLRFPEVANANF